MESLRSKLATYNDDIGCICTKMQTTEDGQTVIAVCTPLIKRVHTTWQFSRELVFVDSSGNMDRQDCRVFIFLTDSPCGALPLGVVITSNESESTITAAFTLLKSLLTGAFFNTADGLEIFLTDDCAALRAALHTVWQSARMLRFLFHLLQRCVGGCGTANTRLFHLLQAARMLRFLFHLLQALCRWLWDSKHQIVPLAASVVAVVVGQQTPDCSTCCKRCGGGCGTANTRLFHLLQALWRWLWDSKHQIVPLAASVVAVVVGQQTPDCSTCCKRCGGGCGTANTRLFHLLQALWRWLWNSKHQIVPLAASVVAVVVGQQTPDCSTCCKRCGGGCGTANTRLFHLLQALWRWLWNSKHQIVPLAASVVAVVVEQQHQIVPLAASVVAVVVEQQTPDCSTCCKRCGGGCGTANTRLFHLLQALWRWLWNSKHQIVPLAASVVAVVVEQQTPDCSTCCKRCGGGCGTANTRLFHLLQALWRWLWNSKQIAKDDRPQLLHLFKAEEEGVLTDRCALISTDAISIKYPRFVTHIDNIIGRRAEWSLVDRLDPSVRGHNTTAYCEAWMRVFKDKIFHRLRAYNVAQLTDFILTRLEDYHMCRLADVANNRLPSYSVMSRFYPNHRDISLDDVNSVGNDQYTVLSSKRVQTYDVDMQLDTCTIPASSSNLRPFMLIARNVDRNKNTRSGRRMLGNSSNLH